MPFTLVVRFSGLCEYLRHSDERRIGIVMPDARKTGRKPDKPTLTPPVKARDGTSLIWHVGYLRYNLADSAVPVPSLRDEPVPTPQFEVIHRFDHEELDFGLPVDKFTACNTGMPDAVHFAPDTTPMPGLFTTTPSNRLLMRTVISGGKVEPRMGDGRWKFSKVLNPTATQYTDRFAAEAMWTRTVDQEELVLTFRDWTGQVKTSVTLRPQQPGGKIELKIANLCADNPLEWEDLRTRVLPMTGAVLDEDFRWFYQLWNHRGGFQRIFRTKGTLLPVPELIKSSLKGGKGGSGPDDCTGVTRRYDFIEDRVPVPEP